MGKRRLTNNNCKMPCSGILGSVRLGRLKAPTPHSTTFFCLRETASQFPLSQTKKRQLFRTLNERRKIYVKIILPKVFGRNVPSMARGIFHKKI